MKGKSRKGISRRDFLKYSGFAAATGALGTLSSRRAFGQAPSVIKPAKELTVAFSGDPGHMDPRVEAGMIGYSIFDHMVETWVYRDKDCRSIPLLAEKWEQASPTALRLYLRKGVKFHNGEDFTAESVKLSIEQVAAPTSRSPMKMKMEAIRDFKIHDPHTIDLITAAPNRPLAGNSSLTYMISPRALRELGDKFSTKPVGTGQMKFVEYRPGQHVVMEPNPDYWGQKSNFQRLRIRFITEAGTRIAALETGEVMMINNVPPDQVSRLRANPNVQVVVSPTNRMMFSTIRCDRKPFNDKRVRQAMNYAVDKKALTQGILGGMAPMPKGLLAEGVLRAHPGLPPYAYDPDRAKKLLKEAGAMGATFNFGAPNGRYLMDRQIGEAIAGFLSEVGLNVKFENPIWSVFISQITKYEKCPYDGYIFGYGVLSGDPDWQMWDHYHSKAVKRTFYNNPEVDRLLDAARETFDEGKVKELYYKAQEIVWEECPWIFLYEQPDICAINKKLKNWTGRRDECYLFHKASLEA